MEIEIPIRHRPRRRLNEDEAGNFLPRHPCYHLQ
jgi:hypothetical protein